MFPFHFEDEVFVLPVGAHHTDGLARADQCAVFDFPGFFGCIDVDPAVQVFSVE
ncbi:hypothetical protein D3C86_1968300 [compost metagenome]